MLPAYKKNQDLKLLRSRLFGSLHHAVASKEFPANCF